MASVEKTLGEFSTLSLYKYKSNSISSYSNQNERRREILQKQKEKRDEILSQIRFSSFNDEIFPGENNENQVHWPPKSKFHRKSRRKCRMKCPIEMMLAEWLICRPEDLDQWFVIPCPIGQRCLIVVHQHQTYIFNKFGSFIRILSTDLPRETILFAIYDSRSSIYYLIDILMWNGQDYSTQIECQCRFFVLQSFEGDPRLNPMFEILPRKIFSDCKEDFPLAEDGYLFYHSMGFYQSGISPLVCWLKPFMIEEILQIPLKFHVDKPPDYTTAENYIFNEQTNRRKSKKEKEIDLSSSMNVMEEEEEEESFS